jgi:hypothetical protein
LNFLGQKVGFIETLRGFEWVARYKSSVRSIKNASHTLAEFDGDQKGIGTIYTLALIWLQKPLRVGAIKKSAAKNPTPPRFYGVFKPMNL